jgi:hypothetical protein
MTRNNEPARRSFVPGDPDTAFLRDDLPKPAQWIARQVQEDEPDFFGRAVVFAAVVIIALLGLAAWASQ